MRSGWPARSTTCRCTTSRCSPPFAGPALPVAEDLCARHVCLPVHSDMTDDEAEQVVAAVTAVYRAMTGA